MRLFIQTLLLVLFSISLHAQWTQTKGPMGGDVSDIISTPGFIFLNSGPAGIFRSTDNGLTWSPANNGLPDYPHCYALKSYGSTLYASIYRNGIYSSADNGLTWTAINNGIENKTFYTLFVDGNDIYVGSEGFFYSSNNGSSWIQRPPFFGQGQVRSFVLSGGKLFAAVNGGIGTYGIWVSEDKGMSWTKLDLPAVTNINAMAAFDNVIYVLGGQPTHISRDYGVTWSTSNIGTSGYYMLSTIHAVNDKVYIGAGNSTIYYSENEGVDFSTITNLPYTGQLNSINYVNNVLLVGGHEGVLASTDNATTWSERNDGLTNHIITSLVASDSYLYAGTSLQGIFVSADNGLTWTKRNNELADNTGFNYLNGVPVGGIYINNDAVVLGIRRGVYKSIDNGQTWIPKLTVSDNSLTHLIGEKNRSFAFTATAQYYSTTESESWISRNDVIFNNTGIRGGMIKGDTIVLLGSGNNAFISKDFGISWASSVISSNVFTSTRAIYVNLKLFVSTWNGIFVSPDLGSTWTKSSNGLATDEVTGLTNRGNDLYAGTTKGVYVSYDQGGQWYPVNEGFSKGDASPLAFNSSFLFSGSYGTSVWSIPVDKLNVEPVCTGITPGLRLVSGETITIGLNDLTVIDPDDNFPADFTMTILPGDNYTVAGNVVTPAADFDGDLSITIVVNDGHNNSQAFIATIGVVVGTEKENKEHTFLYPNPVTDIISIGSENRPDASYCIRDYLGRIVLQNKGTELADHRVINITQLPPGIYFLDLFPQKRQFKFIKK